MKATRLLPLFGVLAVALIILAFVIIGETPDTDDPAGKIASFYVEHDSDVSAGGILLMAAAAAFLAWAVQVRSLLLEREGGSATRTALGLVGAALFAVGLSIFAGINFALGDVPDKLGPSGVYTLHVLSEDLFPPLAVGTLLTLLGYGLAVLNTRAFPVWLGWLAVVCGIFAVTPLWFVPFIGLGVFILVTSVLLMSAGGAPERVVAE
jgi:hypothetical protein